MNKLPRKRSSLSENDDFDLNLVGATPINSTETSETPVNLDKDKYSFFLMLTQLFNACTIDGNTVEVTRVIDYLNITINSNKNMNDAIEILKNLFINFCEINKINEANVDYITFLIVLLMWIQKISNYPPSNADNADLINIFKNENNNNGDNNFNGVFNLFNKNEREPAKPNENDEYIQELEHDNKKLNNYVDTLKLQIENNDEFIIQLQKELSLRIQENENNKKYIDLATKLQNENEELKCLNSNLEKTNNLLENNQTKYELENKNLNKLINDLDQQLKDLNQKLDNINEIKTKLEDNLKIQTEKSSKYEELSIYFESKYNETNINLDKLAILAQNYNELNEALKVENEDLKNKLNEAHINLTRANIELVNKKYVKSQKSKSRKTKKLNKTKPSTKSSSTLNTSSENDLNNFDESLLNLDLTSDLIDYNTNIEIKNNLIENKNENNIFDEIKQVYIDQQQVYLSENLCNIEELNNDLKITESLEIQYDLFLKETQKYNLNEESLKFASYVETFVQLLLKYKKLLERIPSLYELCRTQTFENQNLKLENELLSKISINSSILNSISKHKKHLGLRKSYSMQNLTTNSAKENQEFKTFIQCDSNNNDLNSNFGFSTISNILGDNYDIEEMEDSFNSTTIAPSNGTIYSIDDEQFGQKLLNYDINSYSPFKCINLKDGFKKQTKTFLKTFTMQTNDYLKIDEEELNSKHDENEANSVKITKETSSQTELNMKLKRSLSLPNLNNYLNTINCIYCYSINITKQEQCTQTDLDNESKLSDIDLKIPTRISRNNLCQQLTKDSGIDINQISLTNNNKSKTNSYSSTPVDICDPSDIVIVSTSTRNNSLERRDSAINEFREQETIINEIAKENDVLENSLQKLEKEISKYNIYDENNNNTKNSSRFNENELESAFKKRKIFKESHRKHNTIAGTNYESNLGIIIDDKEFKKHFETQRNSIDGFNPIITNTAVSKAAYKLHFDDEGTQLLDSSRSSSILSVDLQHTSSNSNQMIPPMAIGQGKLNLNDENQSLRNLEILFNEIAMAHYSDQKTLENCIFLYQEKYHKADYMMNLLFENLNITLNKILQIVNEEKEEKTFEADVKKKLQENLSSINNTIKYLKQNLICLISASSTISGLKQEMHLGELIQITISYTRELRKHFMKPFARRMRQTQNEKRSQSITSSDVLVTSQINNSKSNENNLDKNKHNHFKTVVLHRKINDLSSSENDDSLSEAKKLLDTNQTNEKSAINSETSLITNDTTPTAKNNAKQPIIKTNSIQTENNTNDNKYTKKLNKYIKLDKITSTASNTYNYIRNNCRITFKSIRIFFALLIALFAIIVLILAVLQDVDFFQQLINLSIDSIQIRNSNYGRPL